LKTCRLKVCIKTQHVDFSVGFGLALKEGFSDQKLAEKFGVMLGLPEKVNLEKGNFIIFIKDSNSRSIVWRGAVQEFIDVRLDKNERIAKTSNVVNSLLLHFYQGK